MKEALFPGLLLLLLPMWLQHATPLAFPTPGLSRVAWTVAYCWKEEATWTLCFIGS